MYKDTYNLVCWMNKFNTKQKLRIEANTLDLYTTEPTIFTELLPISGLVHEVDITNPNLKIDEIECDKLPLDKYQYRVILKEGKLNDTKLIEVITDLNNEGNIKITNRRLHDMIEYRNTYGDWFYVEDDHSLTLVNLVLGDRISRVLRYKERDSNEKRTME